MALGFKLKWPNLQKRIRELGTIPRAALQPLAAGMSIAALQVLRDSKTVKPSVPVATGALRSTGHVDPPVIQGKKVKVAIGYGGVPAVFMAGGRNRVDYAEIVHDNLAAKHTTPSTAGAKFVETHIKRRRKDQEQSLIRVLDQVIAQLMR